MEKTIKVTLDYYGNKDYGKRVYWIEKEKQSELGYQYVWVDDFQQWKKDMEEKGYEILIEVHEML